jgi:hypothetical protein
MCSAKPSIYRTEQIGQHAGYRRRGAAQIFETQLLVGRVTVRFGQRAWAGAVQHGRNT